MKEGIHINKRVRENSYISSIHHRTISNWTLHSWFSLDVLGAEITSIKDGYLDYDIPHSKELKTLLAESYIKAFKKSVDFNISEIHFDYSMISHWFNPETDRTEDEHYVGIEYSIKFGHWIREEFKTHLMEKRIAMKDLSYVWVMEEYIIPNASIYFRQGIKKLITDFKMNLINEKIKSFKGDSTEFFDFAYKTTGDLMLTTDKTIEFIKQKLEKQLLQV